MTETISLKELLEKGNITAENGKQLSGYDASSILKHGHQYNVSPTNVKFTLQGEHDLIPSVQLESVVLNGFYSVTTDDIMVNMGRTGYRLHDHPNNLLGPFRSKIVNVEFKKK